MELADIIATPAVWMVGALLVSLHAKHLPRRIASWVWLGYWGHLAAAVAQVALTRSYFGGGDMFLYALQAGWLADAIAQNPARLLPEVLALAFQQEAHLPMQIIGAGSSTGSMSAIAGLLFLITGGSLYGALTLVVTGAYLGKLVLYRALRERMPGAERGLLFACLLLPSAVFWSAGLLKESIAIGPLCVLVALLIRASGWLSKETFFAIACAVPVALVKPYILVVLVVAAAVLLYLQRSTRRGTVEVRPLYLALGSLLALGGMVLLGRLFPEYAVDSLAENLTRQQAVGQIVTGGSTYSIASGAEASPAGQLAFAPIAIITSLFRPFFFEIHNAASFVAAVEATLITTLAVRGLAKWGWRRLLGQVLNSPILAFCVVFTLAFGLGVGLGTTNMGTLSRYRMPLMPFWATLLVVWNADIFEGKAVRRRSASHAIAPVRSGARRIRPPEEGNAET